MTVRCRHSFPILLVAALVAGVSACDSGFSGDPFANQPPETALSIRDTSLVDNLDESEKLSSTVAVSWSGDDPDGFVSSYQLRYFTSDAPITDPEAEWTNTTRLDTLILLPIPPGDRTSNVVFEVRAVDNDGLSDPTPARTVLPIENAPPSLRLSGFDLPPDTTFQVVTFAWDADDPEGIANLDRIDISLNDSTQFVSVPADIEFVTLVGDVDPNDDAQTTTSARVYLGRGFQSTEISIPDLRLNADNTLFVRAVDLTDTTSTLERHTWYVKKQTSDILLVNDWRKDNWPVLLDYHRRLLADYLPADADIDYMDISRPFVTGSSGNVIRSEALPPNAAPTFQQTLALYRYVYWVSTNTINSGLQNNLPFAAGASDLFFENGGKMMVHSPISLPENPEDNLGNPALLLLPISNLLTFPDSLRSQLRLNPGAAITPTNPLPGLDVPLPPLEYSAFAINTLPYVVQNSNIVSLYDAEYTYVTRDSRQGAWPGASTVASITADRRIGLFAIPLINEQSGEPVVYGAGTTDAEPARQALFMMLESLGFPKR